MPIEPRRSDNIRVCQVGYLPNETKFAMIAGYPDGEVVIRNASTQESVFVAGSAPPRKDPLSGDELRLLEFSALIEPGEYYIDAPGIGASFPFRIGPDVFKYAFRLAMRSYYGQRCGTDVDMSPDFPEFRRRACHPGPAQYDKSSGRTGERHCPAGWHDAGDYGRYTVNSSITVATIMLAYELNSHKLKDLRLNIPESGGPIPDVLAEVRWNLEWMLTMQDENDGGAWQKATSAKFPDWVMPEDDDMMPLIIGTGSAPYKPTGATADLAAVCAIAARLYAPFDRDFSERCLKAATDAWQWLVSNPTDHLFATNPEGIETGQYSDVKVSDERLWAAAELYRTTGEARFDRYFLEHYTQSPPLIQVDEAPNWKSVQPMAMYAYAFSNRKEANSDAVSRIQAAVAQTADELVARSQRDGYRIPLRAQDYVWGSNSVLGNYAIVLLIANHMTPNPAYYNAALDCLHYMLGRNSFSTSYVTKIGTRYARRPHHGPSGSDGIDEPWPGLIVGGPNNDHRGPKIPNTPPARQWSDDQENASINENAINWNAPLVFILAEALP